MKTSYISNTFSSIFIIASICSFVNAGWLHRDPFEITTNSDRFSPGMEIAVTITPDERASTFRKEFPNGASILMQDRYKLAAKYSHKSPVRIDGVTKATGEGNSFLWSFEGPFIPENYARKVSICLVDTRGKFYHDLTKKDVVLACTKPMRVAPADVPNSEIEGEIADVDLVKDSGIFDHVPSAIQSNKKYTLKFKVNSKVPLTANSLEVYLKGETNLNIEVQNVIPVESARDEFEVTFLTPELGKRAREYKICVKSYGNIKRGCSKAIPVGEQGPDQSRFAEMREKLKFKKSQTGAVEEEEEEAAPDAPEGSPEVASQDRVATDAGAKEEEAAPDAPEGSPEITAEEATDATAPVNAGQEEIHAEEENQPLVNNGPEKKPGFWKKAKAKGAKFMKSPFGRKSAGEPMSPQ